MSDLTDNLVLSFRRTNMVEQRWEILRQISLQKMPILAKKIIFSDEAHFDLGAHLIYSGSTYQKLVIAT